MLDKAGKRLESLGYEFKEGDEAVLSFALQKAENTVKNDCNILSVPDGLVNIVVDMAVGEFLTAKKTFAPNDLEGLDLNAAVKQIQAGDTNVSYAVGDGCLTAEQRLDNFINYLLNYGHEQFSRYRRIIW